MKKNLLLIISLATFSFAVVANEGVIQEYKKLAVLQNQSMTLMNSVVAVNASTASLCEKVEDSTLLAESKQFEDFLQHVHHQGKAKPKDYNDKLNVVTKAVCQGTLTSIVQAWFKETITRYRIDAIENPDNKALRKTYYCLVKSMRDYDRSKDTPDLTVKNVARACGVVKV
ncbi:hypothetical protein CS022_05845 [Veronia nyctiphanis]|uniref:Uncharacterized protein n=1 Tax=Veronia nyctiphanis TaxID=1278244 RepID=A0A4V1LT67_9GAMM|nr:hypothetical protein [Veronia nyctiphanis]RXJ74138.1 hypothetical protein CS022_05845 [Veronia nyctiphanis]